MSPYKAKKNCYVGSCPNLVEVGVKYCSVHAHKLKTDYPRRYPERQKMYGPAWHKLRKWWLNGHPLCVIEGCGEVATVCDHIVDHKGDYEKFMDIENLQSLCAYHHNKKTGKEFAYGKASPKSYDR